jgi:hypothetical protein
MNDHDLLLAMTICELLGKDVYPRDVKDAFKHAQEKFKAFQDAQRTDEPETSPPQ